MYLHRTMPDPSSSLANARRCGWRYLCATTLAIVLLYYVYPWTMIEYLMVPLGPD